MNYKQRSLLACAVTLSMILSFPGMALAEEAASESLTAATANTVELILDDGQEQPDQTNEDASSDEESSGDATLPSADVNPASLEGTAGDEQHVAVDGEEAVTSYEEQTTEDNLETKSDEAPSAIEGDKDVEDAAEAEPELSVAATQDDEVEDIHEDGWADEKAASGKTGRVYYRDGKKLTGYQTINGKGYFFEDGTGFLVVSATRTVNGKLWLFGEDGARITGSGWKDVAGKRYWLASSEVKTGWLKNDGKWYYLEANTGVLYKNKAFVVNGATYVAKEDGTCPSNVWVLLGKKWYLTDGSCAARSGWVKSKGTWYYLDPTTKVMKASETFKVNGKTYIANASGACPANSWVQLNKKWYLTNGSCALRSGWAKDGGVWYYLNPSNFVMKSSEAFVVGGKTYVAKASGACPENAWVKVGNDWYLTDGSCAARTGWAKWNGTWYYLSPKKDAKGVVGKMATGLLSLSGKNYYLFSSGAMAANQFVTLQDGRKMYADGSGVLGAYIKDGLYYNANGSLASGWLKVDGYWYYLESGVPATGWIKDAGKWYWLDSDGRMVTGRRTINGKAYVFDNSGAWIDESSVRKAVVSAAYSQIGAAYTEANDYYEANVAFNCSGFSYWCYLQAGYTIPRKQGYYSYYWNENNKEYSQMWWVESRGNWTTNVSNLKEGDLVFFSPINDKYHTGHVGVYVGNSMMIDAYPGYGVSKRSVWQSGFVGGGNPIF